MNLGKILGFVLLIFSFFGCSAKENRLTKLHQNTNFDTSIKTIHVFVALCDNKYQGIVPVPKAIGNGQDPNNNLYWGCKYGIRTFFKKSKEWKFVKTIKPDTSIILERVVFKHISKNYYLVADAYDGKYIKESTIDFLNSCAGKFKDTLFISDKIIGINGNAKLVSYIGHNGLMDFSLENNFENVDKKQRNTIILACYSKSYFSSFLRNTNAVPLVWSTHLMSPEAYTLHDALTGYIIGESAVQIRTRAAKAYSKYQKCSEKAARGLLVTGY